MSFIKPVGVGTRGKGSHLMYNFIGPLTRDQRHSIPDPLVIQTVHRRTNTVDGDLVNSLQDKQFRRKVFEHRRILLALE